MSIPKDKKLYNNIKTMANSVFDNNKGIYRSMWIVKKYKQMGGEFENKEKNSDVDRWISEKWIDLNQPIKKDNKIVGFEKCGTKNTKNNLYPLCRPSKRINNKTPKLYQELNKNAIEEANKKKQIVKNKGNITFNI
jgi:hypothetical protein